MQRPDKTPAQVAEANIMADLLYGLVDAEKAGGLGPVNPKCCPVLRITPRTRQLMACVTFTDGKSEPWCGGGTSAQPIWHLELRSAMASAISEHYSQTRAAEESSGGS